MKKDNQRKKVAYNAKVSAARGYPCEVLAGSSIGGAMIPYGSYLEASWGRASGSWAIGDGEQAIPDSIYIYYYSYVDDMFYKGVHALPHDTLEQMLGNPYIERLGREVHYDSFTVSLAPCGWVCVWLHGLSGWKEICSFRAEAVDWDYQKAFPRYGDREEWRQICINSMYSFVQQEIEDNRISSKYWERLNHKYKWRLSFDDPHFQVYMYSINLINVERFLHLSSGISWLTDQVEKAIPSDLFFNIKHSRDPIRYKVWIDLVEPWDAEAPRNEDEKQTLQEMTRKRELMDLFEKFYAEAGDEDVELRVTFDDSMQSAQIKLRTNTKEQIIEGCKIVGIFDSDHYNIDN